MLRLLHCYTLGIILLTKKSKNIENHTLTYGVKQPIGTTMHPSYLFLTFASTYVYFYRIWRNFITEFGGFSLPSLAKSWYYSVICGIKKRNIYWLTQIDKKQEFGLINNINVREAIVRPKGDKNLIQQHLRVLKKNNKNSYNKTTKTILRLKAKTT